MSWLETALLECTLTEDVLGYLYGRGARDSTIIGEGIVTWKPMITKSPDDDFRKWCGDYGERMEGFLVCPVRSPKGLLIGFEARSIKQKRIMDFRLPESKWNPFWLGLRTGMSKIWNGGNVWIVEGLFDKCALEWAVPETDVVLASVRAHLSKEHVEFLRRYCQQARIFMVYDNDPTGRRATHGYINDDGKRISGALERLQRVGLNAVEVRYSAKDPGVVWDMGGAKAVKSVF